MEIAKKKPLFEVNLEALRIYYANSMDEGDLDDELSHFFSKRGLSSQIGSKYGVGITGSENQFCEYLQNIVEDSKRDLWISAALELRLINKIGEGYEDSYKSRVIFPIIDQEQNIAGFCTRKLHEKGSGPRYLNSPISQVYDRKKILFGEQFLDSNLRQVILVEGVTDLLKLAQEEVINPLGLLGTTLDDETVSKLSNRFETIYLALDGDEAGRRGAAKICKQFEAVGVKPKIVDLSPWNDPDLFINECGIVEFNSRLT